MQGTTFWNQDHAAVRKEQGKGTQVGWSAFRKLSGSVGAHVPFYPRPPWWFTMETAYHNTAQSNIEVLREAKKFIMNIKEKSLDSVECLTYRQTPLYGHLIITDSLLCPWGKKAQAALRGRGVCTQVKKPLHFLLIQSA